MLQKIREALGRFMMGRHGTDQLSWALLVFGMVLSLLTSLTRIGIFYWLGMAAYVWGVFRIFSRNNAKRWAENQLWVNFWGGFKTQVKQFFTRLKNMPNYRYFKCPQCKARLRLPRKVGEVTVTCGKCHHQFRKKA